MTVFQPTKFLTLSITFWVSNSRNKISYVRTVQCVYDVLVFDVDMMKTAYVDSFFDRTPFIIAQARRHLNDTEFSVVEHIYGRLGDPLYLMNYFVCRAFPATSPVNAVCSSLYGNSASNIFNNTLVSKSYELKTLML